MGGTRKERDHEGRRDGGFTPFLSFPLIQGVTEFHRLVRASPDLLLLIIRSKSLEKGCWTITGYSPP